MWLSLLVSRFLTQSVGKSLSLDAELAAGAPVVPDLVSVKLLKAYVKYFSVLTKAYLHAAVLC